MTIKNIFLNKTEKPRGGAVAEMVQSGGVNEKHVSNVQNSSACSCNHHKGLYWEKLSFIKTIDQQVQTGRKVNFLAAPTHRSLLNTATHLQ